MAAMQSLKDRVIRGMTMPPRALRRPLWRLLHRFFNAGDRELAIAFLDYGYADDGEAAPLDLRPEDEPNRYGIQLYHRAISTVPLAGRDVLEVSCGRGGGASYIVRYHRPRSCTGLDQSAETTALCRRVHRLAGLRFVTGDAEALPFAAGSFDAVITVESSRSYDLERFLREARRVLRPGGHLVLADLRERDEVDALRRRLRASGLAAIEEEEITSGVLRALALNTARRRRLVRELFPPPLAWAVDLFAGTEGTTLYRSIESGATSYHRFVLRRAAVTD
jgi:SAM-dependent methyltransferase